MPDSRRIPRLAAALVASAVLGAGLGRASADQPRMHAALAHLLAAQAELEKASADKGGYRATALRQVGKAIASVQAGIEFDRTH